MRSLVLTVTLLFAFANGINAQNSSVLISIFATDLTGCDDTSACDAFVTIFCQKALGNWVECGKTSVIQNDNFPVWPERFNFEFTPEDQMRWRFDIMDEDVFFNDPYTLVLLGVDEFIATTPVLQTKRIDLDSGLGRFFIHRREM